MNFEWFWRLKSIEIAATEQINMYGRVINTAELFDRAKYIYDDGHIHGLLEWNEWWEKTEKERAEKKETTPEPIQNEQNEPNISNIEKGEGAAEEKIQQDKKKCPSCGELVNKNWKAHLYKKNGEKCGHKFEA